MTMLTQPLTRLVVDINPLVVGNNILVAAKAGQLIRIYRFFITVDGAVKVKWCSNPGTATPMSGNFIFTANGSSALFPPAPGQAAWFETQLGHSLNLVSDTAVNMGGLLDYVQL